MDPGGRIATDAIDAGPSRVRTFAGDVLVEPDAVAIVDTDRDWSYADLDRTADAIGDTLRAAGVRRGDIVAVVTPRTAPGIAGLLAVARSGAAFLAVDPMLPVARQDELIAHSGAQVVVAPPGATPAKVHGFAGGTVIELPDRPAARPTGSAASVERLPGARPADTDPAYLIYTSGSTGEPKGVLVTHGGLGVVAAAERDVLGVGPGSRVYQMATVSFDAFVLELTMALASGATLVLPGPQAGYPGPAAIDRIRAHRVTHLLATPTALRAMDPTGLPDLAVVCSGGERCTADVRDRWLPGRRLLNLYGPAEATIWSTWSAIGADDDPAIIGHPIDGVHTLVLDDEMAPVPPGATGQLFIAGPIVAAGYHRLPDLTRQRFLPVPGGDADARMYATGDLVTLGADGALTFVGRADHQVKVHGARVEPGEVEHALREVPGVAQAVALAVPADQGGMELGAAYTTHGDGPYAAEVTAALRARLPQWLVPQRVARLETLPTSPNGKLDTLALTRSLAAVRPEPPGEEADELTALQEMLLGQARDVLGQPELRLSDGFWEFGGDSMQALELANRAGDALGTELDLADLFVAADLREWIDSVETQLTHPDGAGPRPPVPATTVADAHASVGQVEILVAEQYLAGSAANVIPWCEHVRGPFDADLFADALRATVGQHEALRTRFHVEAFGVTVIVDDDAVVDDERVDGTGMAFADAVGVVERAAARPFRLDAQQPVRLHVVRLADDEHLVTVMAHHAACDAVGFRHLLDAVWRRYRGRPADDTGAPPYRDFAAWQRSYLASHGDDLRRWWREHLAGAGPLRLPGAARRDPVRPLSGRQRAFDLDPACALAVAELCRTARTSPFAVFTAAYTIALEPYLTGVDDVIGTPVTARGRPAFDRTVGFFVNTLPMRLRIPRAGPVRAWLAGWTAECFATLAHRDLPLPEIAGAWRADRRDTRPSVLFALNYTQPTTTGERRRVMLDPGPVNLDLIVTLFGGGSGWSGELVHDTVALPPDDAEALLARFTDAVTAIVTDPDRDVDELFPGLAVAPTATPHAAEVLRASLAEAAEPDVGPVGDAPAEAPVPRLAFVLGPPRSGTTLLRVILGGHPALFAPPELELLQYGTLARRRDALSGRHAFYREGLTRAVMALLDLDAAEADARLDQFANEGLTSAGVYAWLVERAGGRIVVDNTTTYALDAHALRRAELIADRPRYVHLTRHPQACVSSYLAARLDQMYLRVPHRFDAATQAELVWRTAHENVAAFLDTVAPERVLRLSYEELVTAPEAATRRLCDHLGVDFDARMLDIHDDRRARMTDGLRPGGIMLGDVKFHEHRGISTDSLARWREAPLPLHERTAAVARELGYAGDDRVRDTPLTAAQRWMWLLEFLNPGSTMFTVPLALAGDGGLDLDAVHRAIHRLTRRHHALRSLVVVPAGEPVLRFVPDLVPAVVVEEIPAARHEARAAELAGAGFDLAAGSALRLHVLLDGDRFTLLFLVHHIVTDAWSLRLLIRDFLAAYDAWHRGEAPDLPPLRRQPSDAAQEEATADATVAADAARRVRERLDGAVWALNLPPARADADPPTARRSCTSSTSSTRRPVGRYVRTRPPAARRSTGCC